MSKLNKVKECVYVYCEENRPYILRLYKCKNRD